VADETKCHDGIHIAKPETNDCYCGRVVDGVRPFAFAPSPPPAPGRMSDDLETMTRDKLIAACRRARESEKEWKGHYTDLAELLEGRDAEIAALREAEQYEHTQAVNLRDLLHEQDIENARLREALKPLAALAEHYEDDPRMGIVVVTIGHDHVRLSGHDAHVAAAALDGGEEGK
jgi:hypothetical protein